MISQLLFIHRYQTLLLAGRYKNGPAQDRAVVNVEQGKRYRFRIINASAIAIFRLSIEGHTFTAIEADGVNIVAYNADWIEISPGQRYSIVVSICCSCQEAWISLMTIVFPGECQPARC